MYFTIWFFYLALSGNDVLDVIHRMLLTDNDNVCICYLLSEKLVYFFDVKYLLIYLQVIKIIET